MFPDTFEVGDEFGYDGSVGGRAWDGVIVDIVAGWFKYEYTFTDNNEVRSGSNTQNQLLQWRGNGGADGKFHRRGYILIDHTMVDD